MRLAEFNLYMGPAEFFACMSLVFVCNDAAVLAVAAAVTAALGFVLGAVALTCKTIV